MGLHRIHAWDGKCEVALTRKTKGGGAYLLLTVSRAATTTKQRRKLGKKSHQQAATHPHLPVAHLLPAPMQLRKARCLGLGSWSVIDLGFHHGSSLPQSVFLATRSFSCVVILFRFLRSCCYTSGCIACFLLRALIKPPSSPPKYRPVRTSPSSSPPPRLPSSNNQNTPCCPTSKQRRELPPGSNSAALGTTALL